MEQAGIGDIRLIILGVARRPTAYAASTGGAAACLVGGGSGVLTINAFKPLTIMLVHSQTGYPCFIDKLPRDTEYIP